MGTPINKIAEVIKDGNKYLMYFLGIFLFIYFVIVIPHKHPIRNIPVEDAIVSVGEQLDSLRHLLNSVESQRADCIKRPTCSQDSINYFTQRLFTLNDSKIKYQKEIVELEGEPEKIFSIPLLGISVPDTVILSTFPGFIFIGICLTLFYRRRFFKLVLQLRETERKDMGYPVWAFPVPYTIRRSSILSWIATNTIGIFCHFILTYLVLDFMFYLIKPKIGKGEFEIDEIIVINIFIASIAAGFYLYTIFDLIICEWKRKRI